METVAPPPPLHAGIGRLPGPAGGGIVSARVDGVDGSRALLDAAASALADVERALARLDEGTYGTCAECGEPIGDEELSADPTAWVCDSHRAS